MYKDKMIGGEVNPEVFNCNFSDIDGYTYIGREAVGVTSLGEKH